MIIMISRRANKASRTKITTILAVMMCAIMARGYEVEFNVVYPVSESEEQYFIIEVQDHTAPLQQFPLTPSPLDNVTHSFLYSTSTPPSANLRYRYLFHNGSEWEEEAFYRSWALCRLTLINGDQSVVYNEFFNQSQDLLSLPSVPLLSINRNGQAPEYYDDNQVATLSFLLTPTAYALLYDPANEGEEYVKCNMSFVTLTAHRYLTDIAIRRAGGVSLSQYPYSFQVKLTDSMNLGGPDRRFKLKAYPRDYSSKNANIIAEKTAVDICYSLGAPINYLQIVRLFVNHVDQGLYAMLEKVDSVFSNRRWPFLPSSPPGSLYKVRGTFDLLSSPPSSLSSTLPHHPSTSQTGLPNRSKEADGRLKEVGGRSKELTGRSKELIGGSREVGGRSKEVGGEWARGTREYLVEQGNGGAICCPCYEADCSVSNPACRSNSSTCLPLSCCSCTWETNGKLEVEVADCEGQEPFTDFLPLGDSILQQDSSQISQWLSTLSYLSSLIAEMTVMNADGYIYNRKNYYWYRDSVGGEFSLILYDQDTCFTRNDVYNRKLGVYNWTAEADLADGPFLPTLTLSSSLRASYTDLLIRFLDQYYRSDQQGPMFERMSIFSSFVSTFNPGRVDVSDKVYSYINYFILPLSDYLRQTLSLPSLPPLSPSSSSSC